MTGDTLSPQMRRFRKLDARRQTDPPPAPAVRPPVRSSLRPGGGGQFKQADWREPGRGGRARDGRGEEMGSCRRLRLSHRRRLICYPVPSWLVSSFHPSSALCAVPPCSSLVVPPRRSVVVPFLVLFIVPSSRRSVARLVPRPSARPRSPFLDTWGRGRSPIRWRAGMASRRGGRRGGAVGDKRRGGRSKQI